MVVLIAILYKKRLGEPRSVTDEKSGLQVSRTLSWVGFAVLQFTRLHADHKALRRQ